jgi:hypothetical protein
MSTPSKHHGFRVPEGYFKRFPERLSDRLGEGEQLNLPADSGFTVPENYFETFPDRLNERLQRKETPVRPLWPALRLPLAAAAAAVLLLIFLRPWAQGNTPAPRFEDLAGETLEAYLDSGDLDLTAYELTETIPLGDIGLADVLEASPGDQLILEYLENNTDTDDELYWENDN